MAFKGLKGLHGIAAQSVGQGRNKLRRMAPAKPMRRAERRVHLLSVARVIILAEGIRGLTMASLAERAGVSKPVVYDHFDNREMVAIALLDEHFEEAATFVTNRIGDAKTIYEYMEIAIDSLFELQSRDNFRIRNITNGFSSSSDVNEVYLQQQKRTHEVFWGLVRQQMVAESASEVAAYVLMTMVGNTVSEFVGRNNPDDRETLKRMVNGAVRSMLPEQGPIPSTPADVLEAAAKDRQLIP